MDRERWNKKYMEGFKRGKDPSKLLVDFISLATKGRALDIAAGLGRNSLFMAENGFFVDAVDISDVAIERLKTLHPHINPIHQDLRLFRPEPDSYNLIVNINFLDRTLFPYIKESLKKDGVLIFETFLEGTDFKTSMDYLLRRNELLHSFLSLDILFYQEKEVLSSDGKRGYKAYLVAKKRC